MLSSGYSLIIASWSEYGKSGTKPEFFNTNAGSRNLVIDKKIIFLLIFSNLCSINGPLYDLLIHFNQIKTIKIGIIVLEF